MNRAHASSRTRNRRGAVLVIVIVCLLIAAAALTTLVQMTLRLHRQQRQEEFARQAAWLADQSLVAIGNGSLAVDSSTTWRIPASQLSDRGNASIAARIVQTDDSSRIVEVVVNYPVDESMSTKLTRQARFPLASPGE
ncbi:MAG: hypothetical protein KF777_17810 [Planctomycetaceae bacterium]|nr:hypothetical protein [Planctomycetaceae bacterium]